LRCKVALETGDIGVGLSADGFVDLDLKDEVHAAFKVEAEVMRLSSDCFRAVPETPWGMPEDTDDTDGQDSED